MPILSAVNIQRQLNIAKQTPKERHFRKVFCFLSEDKPKTRRKPTTKQKSYSWLAK